MDKDASGDRSRESLGSRFARDKPSSSERLVRKEGFEPPRPFGHKILSLARLPVPPLPQWWFHSTTACRRAVAGKPYSAAPLQSNLTNHWDSGRDFAEESPLEGWRWILRQGREHNVATKEEKCLASVPARPKG